MVATESGSMYRLLGALNMAEMDTYRADEKDACDYLPIPGDIAMHFKYGFPRNWKEAVQIIVQSANFR